MTALNITIIGLSLSSSWGNGHATTFRALIRGLAARGHRVTFLERDVPWYAAHRDLPDPNFCRLVLYSDLAELDTRHAGVIADADLVILGSYVPEGIEAGRIMLRHARGVTAFYDIDTPVTLAALERGDCAYLDRGLIRAVDLYLSFTGGPTLARLESEHGARKALAFYCAVDEAAYRPTGEAPAYDLGYLGTYSPDRQPVLERLLIEPARRMPERRFVVAGPQYPSDIRWPANVERIEHVGPRDHPAFYGSLRFTLNVTRADMVAAGWSPSVRLFEAAACGAPIISDAWRGLDALFPDGSAILIARESEDVERFLALPDARRHALADAARAIVLADHTGEARAHDLERAYASVRGRTKALIAGDAA